MSKSDQFTVGLAILGPVAGYIVAGPFAAFVGLMVGVIVIALAVQKPEGKNSDDIWVELRRLNTSIEKPSNAFSLEASTPETTSSVIPQDWGTRGSGFNELMPKSMDVYWEKSTGTEEWGVLNGSTDDQEKFKMHSRRAGLLLLRSPRIVESLPAAIRDNQNPMYRWFSFIRMKFKSGCIGDDSEGRIPDVVNKSKIQCENCSMDES